jgi:hypothetical protein
MKKSEEKKAEQSRKPWIKQAADQTNYASKDDYGFAPDPVRKFSAEWPGEHGGDSKQRNDQTFVVSSAQFGEKLRQLRNDHIETGKKEQCADAQQPELGTINPLLLQRL